MTCFEAQGGLMMKTQRLATHESEALQESAKPPCMGRLTFGGMYLELPIDDQHAANRKLLGVLGREVKDSETGKRIFTFQELADQLTYGDRRDVQNFHRELRQSDFDVQAFVTRKATKHDWLFPLIEAAILDTPLLSPHQQYLQFCEAHPHESLSEETFRKYANEIESLKLMKRIQQLVKPGTASLDMRGYLREILTCERLSHAKQKEVVELLPDGDDELGSSVRKPCR
jgi:hypothetical protein